MLLISINTQGLRCTTRWLTAFNFLKWLQCDIIFLQETHWTAELETRSTVNWPDKIFIIMDQKIPVVLQSFTWPKRDSHGCIIATKITLDDQEINLVNVYAPRTNSEQHSFYRSLRNYLTNDGNNISGGDFNSIADPQRDKSSGNANAR